MKNYSWRSLSCLSSSVGSFSTSADEKRGRRSFPFPYRPLPQEPTEADHPPQSHAQPTPKGKGVAFTRSACELVGNEFTNQLFVIFLVITFVRIVKKVPFLYQSCTCSKQFQGMHQV